MKTILTKSRLLLFPVVAGILLWFNHTYLHLDPASIRNWIVSFGWLAPFLFVLIYTVRPLVLFPASILSITGGLVFGVAWGTILTVLGATMGAALSFLIARYLGKSLNRQAWQGNWGKLERQLKERGFFYVFLLRLIPLFPFDLISYLSGVSKIPLRSFVYSTFLGIIPGTFAYNYLGSSLTKGSVKEIGIAVLVFAITLMIPMALKRKVLKGDVQ